MAYAEWGKKEDRMMSPTTKDEMRLGWANGGGGREKGGDMATSPTTMAHVG